MKIFKLMISACLVLSIFAMLVACGDGNTDITVSSDTAENTTADVDDESVSEETTEAPEPSVEDNGDSDDIIYDNF